MSRLRPNVECPVFSIGYHLLLCHHLKKFGMTEKGCFIRIGSASEPMPKEMIESLYGKRVRNTIGRMEAPRTDLTFEQLKI